MFYDRIFEGPNGWVWVAAPAAAAVLYALSGLVGTREEKRQAEALARLAKRHGLATGPMPVELARKANLLDEARRERTLELHKGVAYLASYRSTAFAGSDRLSLVMKLAKTAPTFHLRPTPMVDGRPQRPTTALFFQNGGDFNSVFVVEGGLRGQPTAQHAKAVGRFLHPDVREALLDAPDVFLDVEGKVMVLSVYGPRDLEGLEQLAMTADALFAEHGARGGEALLPRLYAAPTHPFRGEQRGGVSDDDDGSEDDDSDDPAERAEAS